MWPAGKCVMRISSIPNHILFPKRLVRGFVTGSCELSGGQLKSRSLIRVSGADREPFLQGLITNDIGHLKSPDGSPSLFTLFLNHQGRVLFDAFLYTEGPDTLIDCHASLRDKLIRHLKLFRVKKAVGVEPVDDLSVWTIYQSPLPSISLASRKFDTIPLKEPLSPLTFCDPRLPQLGWRLILPHSTPPPKDLRLSEERSYRELRYSLGVGEGPDELPFSSSFPLESNGDYLHGISFQKGCYIGQELTARTHHTGVVRKRLMSFQVEGEIEGDPKTLEIVNEKGKVVGKVRGLEGQTGIALTRIKEASEATTLTLKEGGQIVKVSTSPLWWPIQASKEVHPVS